MLASDHVALCYDELPQKNAPLLNICFRFKALLLIGLIYFTIFMFNRQPPPPRPDFKVYRDLPICRASPFPSVKVSQLLTEFHSCISQVFGRWKNDTLTMCEKWHETEICDVFFSGIEKFPLSAGKGKGRRFVIAPKCNERENVMVTIGLSVGIQAEGMLRKFLPNTNFIGIDQKADGNREMYSKIGTFYPVIIGKNEAVSSYSRQKIMKSFEKEGEDEIVTIPFDHLLSDVLDLKKIDFAWIDIGGAEFSFLSQLHRGEALDQKGVRICQIHVEFHTKGNEIEYEHFIHRLISEKRYVFLRPFYKRKMVHQMLILNVEDEDCVNKYLQ